MSTSATPRPPKAPASPSLLTRGRRSCRTRPENDHAAGSVCRSTGGRTGWSTNDGNSCVEPALTPRTVHVRDSKDVTGPSLTFTPLTWAHFVPYASEVR
ncbi:DUF397 domain-containing protein [Streptomyces werraensis]|uniref:DUF397 domain-containing protein n=1 Tax=Streptomyces werraensis TaxID=68284 RepID=UPI003F4DBFEC